MWHAHLIKEFFNSSDGMTAMQYVASKPRKICGINSHFAPPFVFIRMQAGCALLDF
jgi:hypothetical protein